MPIFIQYTLSILGFIFAVGYGYGQWKQGKNQVRIDTMTLLKSDVETLKDKVIELTAKIQALTVDIESKDKRLKELLEILQGRDPELKNFITESNAYMILAKPILTTIVTDVIPVVKRLDKYLDGVVIK